MKNTFYLIRHGQKNPHVGDPALTELGQNQAQKTGLYLKQFPISQIIASPMLRTQQTAQAIANQVQVAFETDALLKERMNWGDQKDESFEEFLKEWNKATHNRDYVPTGHASSQQTGQRVEAAIAKYSQLELPEEKHIVLVTHGGAITDFLRNVFSDEHVSSLLKDYGTLQDYQVAECSITVVSREDDKFVLEQLVYCDHL